MKNLRKLLIAAVLIGAAVVTAPKTARATGPVGCDVCAQSGGTNCIACCRCGGDTLQFCIHQCS
ncbi:MAG TPA: hypothetical protein VF173_05395 [Thermoanaerobaculia bacterium]|nr:hypothetical protein [Thermoanaerobaculia bacterium]